MCCLSNRKSGTLVDIHQWVLVDSLHVKGSFPSTTIQNMTGLLVLWFYRWGMHSPRGGDLVSNMPVCVCSKVKDMGPFSMLSE